MPIPTFTESDILSVKPKEQYFETPSVIGGGLNYLPIINGQLWPRGNVMLTLEEI